MTPLSLELLWCFDFVQSSDSEKPVTTISKVSQGSLLDMALPPYRSWSDRIIERLTYLHILRRTRERAILISYRGMRVSGR